MSLIAKNQSLKSDKYLEVTRHDGLNPPFKTVGKDCVRLSHDQNVQLELERPSKKLTVQHNLMKVRGVAKFLILNIQKHNEDIKHSKELVNRKNEG
jgi:hypothetical protein